MAGTPIGRILLMPKGDYSGSAVYNSLDWVRHSGSAWVCTTDNTTGVTPAAGVPEWTLMASDGSIGGWSSLTGKPFETLGKGVKKDTDDSLTLNIADNLLLGSKLDVDVQSIYSASGTKPINGTGVASAISGKADSTDLDSWVGTYQTVTSAGEVTFSNVDDTSDNGYVLMCERPNVSSKIKTLTDPNTDHMEVVFTVTGAQTGDKCKLRILK